MKYISITKIVLIGILLSCIYIASADNEVATVATVENAQPHFLEFWIDGHGPVKYYPTGALLPYEGDINKGIVEEGVFYSMKGDAGEPVPPYDSKNPNNYIIRVQPPAHASTREIPIVVKIQDSNGYDDISNSEVSVLFNTHHADKKEGNVAPPAIVLERYDFDGVDAGYFRGNFTLHQCAAAGVWTIQFRFRDNEIEDEGRWYYTDFGYFYDDPYIAISIYDSETAAQTTDGINFGLIDPDKSSTKPLYVQNDGNVGSRIEVELDLTCMKTSGNDAKLKPYVNLTRNSDGTLGDDDEFFVEQPQIMDNHREYEYFRGMAENVLYVPPGTPAGIYSGSVHIDVEIEDDDIE